jgi:hypothetical protein
MVGRSKEEIPMNWKKIAAVAALSAVTLGIGGSAFAAAPSPTSAAEPAPSTSTEKNCLIVHDDAWPAWTQGRPDGFTAGDTGGVYMWHDNDGWHIRVTHATDDKSTFSGFIVTTGHLVDVQAIALEKNDSLNVGAGGHSVTFRFENYGHIDGLDFHTRCAPSITFGFARADHRLPADRVFVGDHKTNPARDPFRITRTK